MVPIHTVVINMSIIYTFVNLANNKVGIIIADKIIKPPIVGVPFFSDCPSKPKSLMVSPTCFLCKKAINLFPINKEINSETMIAKVVLKVIN